MINKLKHVFYELLREMVARYDDKNNPNKDKIYICTNIYTRNRHKRDEYKIPENKPQCPIYEDNRCCGSCKLARTCDHCVDCQCFGYTYAITGGIKCEMNHKASKYYGISRLNEKGEFDWDYYNEQKRLMKKEKTIR